MPAKIAAEIAAPKRLTLEPFFSSLMIYGIVSSRREQTQTKRKQLAQ